MTTDPTAIQHSFVVPQGYAARAARTYLAFRYTRTSQLIAVIVVVIATTFVGLALATSIGVPALAPIFPLFVNAGGWLGGFIQTKRQFSRDFVEGAVIGVAVEPTALVITAPSGKSELSYEWIESVTTRAGLVILKYSRAAIYVVLPHEVLPEDAVARVRASVTFANRTKTTEIDDSDVEGIPMTNRVDIDADYAARAARAYVAFSITRPSTIAAMAVLVVALFGVALANAREPGEIPIAIVVVVGGYAAFTIAFFLVLGRSVRKGVARQQPADSCVFTGFNAQAMASRTPLATSVIPFQSFEKVWRRNEFVFARMRGSRAVVIYAAKVFTDDALAAITASARR
jgi:hypothetical protein